MARGLATMSDIRLMVTELEITETSQNLYLRPFTLVSIKSMYCVSIMQHTSLNKHQAVGE